MIERELIQVLKSKVGVPSFPPVNRLQIDEAESQLGFHLPHILVELYMQVGNGGFGPYCATLTGINKGSKSDIGMCLVERYHAERSWSGFQYRYKGDLLSVWPEKLLTVFEWPCNIYNCVDCGFPEAPVYMYDANAPRDQPNEILLQRASLMEWLVASVEGVDLWQEMESLRNSLST